jgi:hypothetical protein
MNRSRILAGLAASVGFSVAVACGSSSSNNGGGADSANYQIPSGTSSGSSGSSGAGSGDDLGDAGCASGQALCLGITGNSCVTPGQMCLGTMVLANECSATSACPGGQVCCSSYVGADGGVILIADAGASGDAGASPFNFASLGSIAVQCMAQCPSNALSSQVCLLEDDGGSPTACPEGTTCRDYLPTAISSVLPNTLCLAVPTYDGGTGAHPATEGGAGTGASDGADATTSVTDAAPE